MGIGFPSVVVLPSNQSPWKLLPLSGCSSPLPVQCGTLTSSIRTFDQITSVPGSRKHLY